MRMFLYYIGHTFVNQIRKLFKTWVVVFILICFVMGGVIGFGASLLSDKAEETGPEITETQEYEQEPQEPDETEGGRDPARVFAITELAVGLVMLAMLVYSVLSGEKSGSSIFMMADVNLLFSAPLKPQSVLLFRLVAQMGAMIAASIYLVFQIPNLILNAGFSALAAIAVLIAWVIILIVGRLFSVLTYSLVSTYPGFRKYVRPAVYAVIAVVLVAVGIRWRGGGMSVIEAAAGTLNAPWTRWIPFWGWTKGFVASAAEGRIGAMIIYLVLTVAACILLTYIIWELRVDFYEDALARSSEAAERRAAMEEGKAAARRKKDRADDLKRDGLSRGWGANVYFWKSMYNRFRFAKFGFVTKTLMMYLVIGAGGALFLKYAVHYEKFVIIALAFGAAVFFRSLGNPIAQDTQQANFGIIPEKSGSKVAYSLLAGTVNCLLDMLPGYLIAAVLLRAEPLFALVAMIMILSIDLYSSTVGTFIDLSLPTNLAKMVKSFIQILFIYFGLIPIAGILAYGMVTKQTVPFMAVAILFCLAISCVMFAFIPGFIRNGRK